MPGFSIAQLDRISPQSCPCGTTRRAFAEVAAHAASLHLVEIHQDARVHYHRNTTEIYLVLEGQGQVELDGQLHPVRPMTAIYIPPGCRHRALGPLKLVNLPVPAFDPQDEYFD
jgi:mannose-6-phosphate isomerase-like protein (cupin superfamily)